MTTLLNTYSISLVLRLINTTHTHWWRVSQGLDSMGSPLHFWAEVLVLPAVSLEPGDLVRCTVTVHQYLTDGHVLSCRSVLTDLTRLTESVTVTAPSLPL